MKTKQKTPVRKIDATKQGQPKPKPKSKAKAAVEQHVSAVDISKVPGMTGLFNAGRPVKILLDIGKTVDKLTDRSRLAFYALRDAYGNKLFSPRGLDNGIMRDLVACGLVNLTGGQEETVNGRRYMIDGTSPTQAKVSATGMKYGKA